MESNYKIDWKFSDYGKRMLDGLSNYGLLYNLFYNENFLPDLILDDENQIEILQDSIDIIKDLISK